LQRNTGASPAVKQIILEKIARTQDLIVELEEILEDRFSVGLTHPSSEAFNNEVMLRRQLLADLRAGSVDVAEVLSNTSLDVLLSRTHAFALLRSQHGHIQTVEAFRQHNIPFTVGCTKSEIPRILAIHHLVKAAPDAVTEGRKRPTPEQLEKRRGDEEEKFIHKLKRGHLQLTAAPLSRRHESTLKRCKIRVVVHALVSDCTSANEITRKIGGSRDRRFGDLSNLERHRLIRLISQCAPK
jgi:hypothetical protein